MPRLTSRTIEWVPLMTMRGVSPNFMTWLMDEEDQLDTEGASSGVIRFEARYCSDCKVYIEGSDTGGNDYTTLISQAEFIVATPAVTVARLNRAVPVGQATRLYKNLRVRITADDGVEEWATTFRVTLSLAG